ncbi:MAG: recombination protein O N-terminal domain-containing protein, partial [Victivallaceae bacterium]
MKKIVYREHDLIVHGISPDFGRLDLLAAGEMRSSDRQLPVIGLFRELEVAIEAPGSTLVRIDRRELIGECDAIGSDPATFDFAVKSGAFLLKNCAYGLPSPLIYDT